MRATPHSILMGLLLATLTTAAAAEDRGVLPRDASGRSLNLDFETGDLRDWRADGDAFQGQPVKDDAVYARRKDMRSHHAGQFWVGSFEGHGDRPHGTLTSATFTLTHPFAQFLIAGGSRNSTRFEIVRQDTGKVVYQTSGDDSEELKPVSVDLSGHVGKPVLLRLVDQDSDGWGHINFDDFRLWSSRPPAPPRTSAPLADVYAHDGLSPRDAAAAMTVPAGFKVTLFAGEPDVVQPIAQAIDDRGRLWVAEAYSYPVRVPQEQARDRILIFEDTNHDGTFDTRKVFADKLNLVSGLEVGFGGVWVGSAPEFLFIPDRDGDDQPDGPPQVLLDGWGYHDTHETLNSFNWGPDGWLYGCHGVFTHSRVGKPGTPDEKRVPLNAAIWRYHPTRHQFEVFAHGTSNPWGVDFDAHGQSFLTACVIPHLYHIIQNARYERQAGPHFNPYTYDDIKTIADHRHYVGANPHGGNGRSDSAGGGHAHAGALIYLGGAFPAEYRGSLFMNNIHGARLNRDLLEARGSGFVGHHAPDFLLANDRWSQIVNLRSGPDGGVFLIDWYDKNQCHRNEVAIHDRTNGRVFKVTHGEGQGDPNGIKANAVSSLDLVKLLSHKNDWYARHARRLLQERAPRMTAAETKAVVRELEALAFGSSQDTLGLIGLWTLHAIAPIDEPTALRALASQSPYLRAWGIQLYCETHEPSSAMLDQFAKLARSDASPVVRLYLAAALPRMPLAARWSILEGLVAHEEDVNDHNLPLMTWYAAEPLAAVDASRALALAVGSKFPNHLPFMVRRVAAVGTPETIASVVDTLGKAGNDPVRLSILEALNLSLQGRRRVDMPAAWAKVGGPLQASGDGRVRSQATALALTFGDPAALKVMRGVLDDRAADLARRREALASLLKAHDPDLPAVLRKLVGESTLRGAAIRGLAAYDDPATAGTLLAAYANLSPDERRDALNTLAARVETARALLSAVGDGKVASKDLTADLIRQIRNLRNPELETQIGKVWGTVRETTGDRARLINRFKTMLTSKAPKKPDLSLGRAVFARTCQQCHTLFATGAQIGPELTGSNRADLDYLLSNVLDPSALIGKDYVAHVVATTDGRVLTGLIRGEDKDAVTLQTANELVVIPRAEIDQRRPSEQSMMPDDLWTPLSEHEVRSLVAYLASPAQVPMLATPENVAAFFNGRDLTGWDGDPSLWSVENGELVGKTKGLKRNQFLRSTLTAENFKLRMKVKLVANEGNSGVQFRSEALPDGEMRGYQADIGPGWWGKLYEENGRALLWKTSGEAYLKPGEWNTYEIVAEGSHLRTFLNGQPCVDLDDPAGARRGIFAFQLHSGGPTEVRYKELSLELLKP